MGDTYNRMAITVSDILKNIFIMGSRSVDCYFIAHYDNEKYNFSGPNNETILGLKLLLTQRTQWCDYIE